MLVLVVGAGPARRIVFAGDGGAVNAAGEGAADAKSA
jgi:hypothetical protein